MSDRIDLQKMRESAPELRTKHHVINEVIGRFADQQFTAHDVKMALKCLPEYKGMTQVAGTHDAIHYALAKGLGNGTLKVVDDGRVYARNYQRVTQE